MLTGQHWLLAGPLEQTHHSDVKADDVEMGRKAAPTALTAYPQV